MAAGTSSQTTHQHAVPSEPNVARHLLLYDGQCGLCNRTIQFILPRDPGGRFRFAALQSQLGREKVRNSGRDPDQLTTFLVVENYESTPRLLAGARAALFIAGQLGQPWRYLTILKMLPDSVLEWGYRVVSRNRYRLFGKSDQCLLPPASHLDRFIDR